MLSNHPNTLAEDETQDIATALCKVEIDDVLPYTIVDSRSSIATLVDTLSNLPTEPPSLCVDLEGVNLSPRQQHLDYPAICPP
jgi:hypothetical protein